MDSDWRIAFKCVGFGTGIFMIVMYGFMAVVAAIAVIADKIVVPVFLG